MQGALIFHLT